MKVRRSLGLIKGRVLTRSRCAEAEGGGAAEETEQTV
jgi:hypothetical protein